GAGGMRTMAKVIARLGRIIPARVPNAVVDGVMPVVIVIGSHSVPAAVVRLEGVMRPAHACVCARYRNPLSPEAQCPHIGRVRVGDSRLDRLRTLRRLIDGLRLGKVILDVGIAFYPRYVRASSQRLGNLTG